MMVHVYANAPRLYGFGLADDLVAGSCPHADKGWPFALVSGPIVWQDALEIFPAGSVRVWTVEEHRLTGMGMDSLLEWVHRLMTTGRGSQHCSALLGQPTRAFPVEVKRIVLA